MFYRLLASKTMPYKGDSCASRKWRKENLTVLVAANMTGMEKLPRLVTDKALKFCCFKNICTLQAECTANCKACVTREILK